jgi:deoxyribose-phosphate aldolase
MTEAELVRLIDHTLLRPGATPDEVERLCREAQHYRFAVAMVAPVYVATAVRLLEGSDIPVGTVIGFPHGTTLTRVKLFEAERALALGARELDMVMDIGALRAGREETVEAEIRQLAALCHSQRARLKIILETALLSAEEKRRGALLALQAGADFVKTSTGFGPGGATVEDVRLLYEAVEGRIGVKASGGIRTLADLQRMVAAGATRIGTSSGVRIVEELRATQAARS